LSGITLFAFTLTFAGCSKKEEPPPPPPPPAPAPAAPAPADQPAAPSGDMKAGDQPAGGAPMEKNDEGSKTKKRPINFTAVLITEEGEGF